MVISRLNILKERALSIVIVAVILFFLIAPLSYLLNRMPYSDKRHLYYVPPLNYLSLLSGTHKLSIANLFFIRGILDLSEEFPPSVDRTAYLLRNFEIASTLNPQLLQAYFFAGIVVPRTREEIPRGIKFLKEALKRNSQAWEIAYWLGFNYYQLGEYSKTIEYYKIASSYKDAPSFLKTNLAYLYYRTNQAQLGILYLKGLLESIKDRRLLELIELKIAWLKNIIFLEDQVKKFKEIYGLWPKALEELIEKGLIDKIPEDPFGKRYELDEEWYKGPARVKSRF